MAGKMPPPNEPSKRKKIVPRPANKNPAHQSAAMKYLRDSRIVRDRLSGMSLERCAERHGVRPDTARKIVANWNRYVEIATDEEPLDYLNRRLLQYDIKYDELAEILDSNTSDEVKISAIRAQLTAIKDSTLLRQQHGVLPKNLGKLTVAVDFRVVGQTIARILDEEEVPVPVLSRIEAALRSAQNAAGVIEGEATEVDAAEPETT